MLLAIDCGNTNVVFGIYDGDALRAQWRISTQVKRTADEYAVWLSQLLTLESLTTRDVTGAIVASVVPAAVRALDGLCKKYFEIDALVVGRPGIDVGCEVRIQQPRSVGADRLVNGLSAHMRFGGPLIVIDFGTATTFDVIGDDGAYEGGVIAPGVNASLEALFLAAAKLPRIAIEGPPRPVIGQGTEHAMQSGAYWGYVGLIESLVTRIRNEDGRDLKVIATGGLAPLFAEAAGCIDEIDPDITLRGLNAIYKLNRPWDRQI